MGGMAFSAFATFADLFPLFSRLRTKNEIKRDKCRKMQKNAEKAMSQKNTKWAAPFPDVYSIYQDHF